ncbi:MAG TPA: DUF1254 domain-containing protein [Acidimicrobiia bacterium]|nr:DUF1254 domain-containing protein [Acidimicrobiia bacterium]
MSRPGHLNRWRLLGVLGIAALVVAGAPAGAASPTRAGSPANDGLTTLRAVAASAAASAPNGVNPTTYRAAIEAYIWGYPLVVMARTRSTLVCATGANTFLNQTSLTGPTTRLVVTPNTDTLYSSAFLDLRSGPVTLRIPALPDRYYVFQLLDMYTNTIANIGTRTIGPGPASVAVTPPNWKGRLPAGTRRLDAPTLDVWVIGRTLPRNAADVPNVVALQHEYDLTSAGHRTPETEPPLGCGGGSVPTGASGASFFGDLGAALAANPPPAGDAPVLQDLRAAGIGPGLNPATNASPAALAALTQSVRAANAAIATAAARNLTRINGWSQVQHLGVYGHNYLTRAAVAEAALGANVPAESVYYTAAVDHTGTPLVGTRPVTLHFAAGQLPPVERHGFWSVTLYGPDHYLVANPIDRYAVGDRTAGLQRNADGSLDLYLGAQPPAGHDANWLPAPPGSFNLVLRAYLPAAPIRRGTWQPPTVGPSAP